MGWFKRLCLFVYGLAGVLALLALSLPWVGPYTQEATSLLYVPDYFRALEVVVGITGVGCLVCLLRAIFTPRNYKNIIITSDAGDQITVTRSAIASQAQHIVERDGSCVAGTVRVHAKKRGSIRVLVRVTPKRPLDVVAKGRQLQAELDEGLAKIAADKIKSVNLEFTDPQEMDDEDGVTVTAALDETPYDVSYDTYQPSEATEPEPVPQAQEPAPNGDGNGITVPLSSFHREALGDGASPEAEAPAEDGATAQEAEAAAGQADEGAAAPSAPDGAAGVQAAAGSSVTGSEEHAAEEGDE